MRNRKSQNVCPNCNLVNTTNDTKNVSRTSKLLTSAEIELLEFVGHLDRPDLANSLKLIHDFAIYHSSIPFDDEEKTALYDVRALWEKIEEMIE